MLNRLYFVVSPPLTIWLGGKIYLKNGDTEPAKLLTPSKLFFDIQNETGDKTFNITQRMSNAHWKKWKITSTDQIVTLSGQNELAMETCAIDE